MELCGRQKVVQRKMVLLLVISMACWFSWKGTKSGVEATVPVARLRRLTCLREGELPQFNQIQFLGIISNLSNSIVYARFFPTV